jgi:hypothetical protein
MGGKCLTYIGTEGAIQLGKESSPSDKAINDNTQPPAKVGRKAYRVSIETAGLPKYQPIFCSGFFDYRLAENT